MDFNLTPKQREVYELTGQLARRNFAPRAAAYDRDAVWPKENFDDFRDNGLLTLTIAEDQGGWGSGALGDDPLLYLLVIEQTARACLSTAQCIHIHSHGSHLLDRVGTPAQKKRILGAVTRDGALLNATGSEPGRTGRGVYNLLTKARRAEGGYVLNGRKNYATLGDVAAYNIVFGVLEDVPGPQGHLGFAIPQGASGFTVVEGSWRPLGMRGASSPDLLLEDVFVPDDLVIGTPGFFPRDRWQAKFHLGFAAQYLGGAQGLFDLLVDYIPKRGTAGDAYAQLRTGEIRIGIEATRWLIYRAAWLWTQGDPLEAELASILAKHKALDNAVIALDKAAQILGSSAFAADSAFSRLYRDLRVQTLHENPDRTAAILGQYHLGQPYDTTARL